MVGSDLNRTRRAQKETRGGKKRRETRQFFARSPPSERLGQASPNLLFSPK